MCRHMHITRLRICWLQQKMYIYDMQLRHHLLHAMPMQLSRMPNLGRTMHSCHHMKTLLEDCHGLTS